MVCNRIRVRDMLKVESSSVLYPTRLGKSHINLCNEMTGEAKVNLPLELSLPADPVQWTKRQTQNWLCWLREANDIDQLDITDFNIDGSGLCSLSSKQIEKMVGLRAANIFRSTLDLLQSTAALVRNSPPALSPPLTRHSPSPPRETVPTRSPIFPSRETAPIRSSPIYPGRERVETAPTRSPIYPGRERVETAPTRSSPIYPGRERGETAPTRSSPIYPPLNPNSPRVGRVLPLSTYQTPCTMPSFNRSSVITSEDIARLQPIAGECSPLKIESRRSSSECETESIEGEEEKLYTKYFNKEKTEKTETKPLSNGIDCGRQGVTLWQFILELLADKDCNHIVSWTDSYLEFKVMNSKEMANRWGARKNRPKMNYDKLSRALRYYYRKNLIQHVPGKRQVYFFVEHPESLDFTQLLNNALRTHPLRNRTNSAFTHIGSGTLSTPTPTRAGTKRYNSHTELEYDIKKPRVQGEQGPLPLSMLGFPGMVAPSTVNQLLSLQSPLLSPPAPFSANFYLGKVENLELLKQQQQHLDYQRLAAIQAAVLAPIQLTEPHNTYPIIPRTTSSSIPPISHSIPPISHSIPVSRSVPAVPRTTHIPIARATLTKPSVVHKISILDTGSVTHQ